MTSIEELKEKFEKTNFFTGFDVSGEEEYNRYQDGCELYEVWNFIEDAVNSGVRGRSGFCVVCGEPTTCVYNIKFKAENICESCGHSIAHQEMMSMFGDEDLNERRKQVTLT
jgi:hypothetical protein